MTGKILRLGHMGDVNIPEIADAMRVMGGVLAELGRDADGERAAAATVAAHDAAAPVPVAR